MRGKPNRLLEFLTTPPKPEGKGSRSNRRRRSSIPAQLCWREGTEWRMIGARLLDISRAGAALVTTRAPALTKAARVRFDQGDESPWIEAEILAAEPEGRRKFRVRVRFETPCPNFLLKKAVLGVYEVEDQVESSPYLWAAAVPGESD
jgi:hypothetical protein